MTLLCGSTSQMMTSLHAIQKKHFSPYLRVFYGVELSLL